MIYYINMTGVHFLTKIACFIVDAHCCHMGTAIKHTAPDRVELSFVIFDMQAL